MVLLMQKELVTDIKEIIQRTPGVKSFRLNNKEGIDFKAGQFLSISIGEGKDFTRYLTISSSPNEKGYIEVTKKITDSEFSKKLNMLKKGDRVQIKYPFGNFTLEGQNEKKIAFLSGGIGVTPIRSMSKYACDLKLNIDSVLIYGNRTTSDIVFKGDFDAIQKECRNFKVVYLLANPEDTWRGRSGHIDKRTIEEEIPDYKERKFHICGPPLMVTGMKQILSEELNLQNEHIITENFVGY